MQAEKSRLATKAMEDLRHETQLNAERDAIRQQENAVVEAAGVTAMEKVTVRSMI